MTSLKFYFKGYFRKFITTKTRKWGVVSKENDRSNVDTKVNHVPWFLGFAAAFLLLMGVATISAISYGFATGRLLPYWNDLGDGRGSIIGQLFTVYAAAFAAVFVPLIFRGQIRDLKRQVVESGEQIRELAEESKNSFRILNEYALLQAGIKAEYKYEDLANAAIILKNIQTSSAALCSQVLEQSELHWRTKAAFRGKWPGNKPFVRLLKENDLISDDQLQRFFMIAESSKFAKEGNQNTITVAQLNLINSALISLKGELSDEE